jgi:CRP/FNR family transcriptional regulator, cyclic AMP receptor protein
MRLGDPAQSAILLLEGLVKVHRSTAEGAEVILGLEGPGSLLGEISAVGPRARSADVSALEPVQGRVVAVDELRRLLLDHPGVAIALLGLALQRLWMADAARMAFSASESLARVTSRLIELAERFGVPAGEGLIETGLPITQDELASWSASSRESTARALRTLRDLGLIETRRRHLVVRDLDRLRTHAVAL